MVDQEGVIKFKLSHSFSSPLPLDQLGELIAWRRILYQLQLIGEDPFRYEGYGFGNISQRIPPFDSCSSRPFIITGTQTGSCPQLGPDHFTTVTECFSAQNRVTSTGPIKPSSEAMTHATLYEIDSELRVVMHVHSPHIRRSATQLGLPVTTATATCGTAAMTAAVRELMTQPLTRKLGVFVMGGHEDGVVSFGRTADQAGTALLCTLAKAYQSI
jgi:hypothetical protein